MILKKKVDESNGHTLEDLDNFGFLKSFDCQDKRPTAVDHNINVVDQKRSVSDLKGNKCIVLKPE